jgi:hypothetical protein
MEERRMRIMGTALASVAIALGGMLVVSVAETASAKGVKECYARGKFTAYQNGECVSTTVENPDRTPNQSAQFYRSHHKKKHTAKAN